MKYVVDGKMCTMQDLKDTSLEKRLQRMEDRNAICEALYHYAQSTDKCDPDGQASCFAEQGVLKWGDNFKDWYVGRETIRAHLKALMGAALTSSHYVTNVQILFEDDDTALVHAYFYAWQHFKVVTAAQQGGYRGCEQFDRPWPPRPILADGSYRTY